jgi:hypothetical protein
MGARRGAYRVVVEKSEGRRPLGRPRHRWEDNIKKDLQAVGWRGKDWDMDRWQALVNELIYLRAP